MAYPEIVEVLTDRTILHSFFVAGQHKICSGSSKSRVSDSSMISTAYMFNILEKLKMTQVRKSTANNYISVWRNFNNFVIHLDKKPKLWEERATLFLVYLVNKGHQSAMIKSYLSAIKTVLVDDGYQCNDNLVLLNSIMKACRIANDKVKCRLPIQCGLLETILFEVQRIYGDTQPYLEILYKAIFALALYGLMQIGGPHPLWPNAHWGTTL